MSPYGVHDMTGNVDEWVVNESGHPYKSGLKGGYWGPVRDRCRPMTTAHNEDFAYYQIGFRCCSDVQATGTGSGSTPKSLSPPRGEEPGGGGVNFSKPGFGGIDNGGSSGPSFGSAAGEIAGS